MGKFSLHDFVLNTIHRMISGGDVVYRIMQYSAGWYEKDLLTDEDMMQISEMIETREFVPIEPDIE